MYGAGSRAHELADMRVETGEERIDFYLQEALHDRMGSRHASGPYVITTETDLRRLSLGVGAEAIARRYAIQLTVDYEVHRLGSLDPVVTGSVTAEAGFDAPLEMYGNIVAQQDAEERAAQAAADRMISQLVRHLEESEAW